MDQDRRKTIIREIDYWRGSKLLPEQYCHFLLNLYLDEGAEQASPTFAGKAASVIRQSSGKHWFLVIGGFSLICLIGLYFNVFHPVLQTALSAIGVLLFLAIGLRLRPRNEPAGLIMISLGMLFMLGIGLYMLKLHELDSWGWNAAYLAFCSLCWVGFGAGTKIPVLHLCGWAATALVYALLLSKNAKDPEWYEVQLFWVPVAFVFAWFSWFVHRWSKQASGVLFVTAALLWFMPELYSALFMENQTWLQIELIIKIAIGGVLMFSLRKRWIAWVA